MMRFAFLCILFLQSGKFEIVIAIGTHQIAIFNFALCKIRFVC